MVILGDYANRYLLPSILGESREGVGEPDCGAAPGTTILKTAVPRPATTTIGRSATTSTTILVFVLSARSGVLFTARVGRWESVESATEESSLHL
ncbi:hypothetical protein NIES23_19150 [Trichormus variabilis NIES-23]|uniref:Uncharacterized protein n=1 Tax=Trichormus variabilis NIES-23 TaxID=1973479 RepID=A0A1Z4KJP3_ANAVA|nr:hypothetical protein NIES23_19150 [Trichormus variabilis NIES-23]